MSPDRRAAAAGRDYWIGTDVCWRYLVGVHVVLGYFGRYRRRLRTLMPRLGSRERTYLVAT